MSKRFTPGLKYTFTKKKYIQDMGRKDYKKHKEWVNSLNGGQVKPIVASYFLGSVRGHSVVATWCKCIGRLNDEN